MKMTVEKIREILSQDKAKKEAAYAEVEELARKLAALEGECQAAVDAGNVDAYYQKRQEKEKTADALYVKKVSFDKNKDAIPVTEDAVREAWENYVSPYNKKLVKAMAEFKAKRDELNSLYSAMVDLQQKACETREFLAAVVGVPDYEMVKKFNMECLPAMPTRKIGWTNDPGLITISGCDCADPDAVYYLACYEQNHGCRISAGFKKPEEAVRIQRVVGNQRT